MDLFQSKTFCKRYCELNILLFWLNTVGCSRKRQCNSEDLLGAACQLSHFGRNMILGHEQKIRSPN